MFRWYRYCWINWRSAYMFEGNENCTKTQLHLNFQLITLHIYDNTEQVASIHPYRRIKRNKPESLIYLSSFWVVFVLFVGMEWESIGEKEIELSLGAKYKMDIDCRFYCRVPFERRCFSKVHSKQRSFFYCSSQWRNTFYDPQPNSYKCKRPYCIQIVDCCCGNVPTLWEGHNYPRALFQYSRTFRFQISLEYDNRIVSICSWHSIRVS